MRIMQNNPENRDANALHFAFFALLTVIGLTLASCDSSPTTDVDHLAQKAAQAAEEAAAATIEPHEIKMIEYRRGVMGKPGLQLYVVFLNDMGQPIDYFVTEGKCSSSNKRLTDSTAFVQGDRGSYYGYFDVPAASEDGTYGESDEYVFCRTVDGKYKQWNGDRLISDQPIELTIKPLVIDRSGRNQQQQ